MSEPAGAGADTVVTIAAGPMVGPVLRRVVGMLAARADLPLDRLDDAVLVADVIATRAPTHAPDAEVRVAMRTEPRALHLRVGPLSPGGARALVGETAVPGMGNVMEQLADEIDVQESPQEDYLRVRLAYAG